MGISSNVDPYQPLVVWSLCLRRVRVEEELKLWAILGRHLECVKGRTGVLDDTVGLTKCKEWFVLDVVDNLRYAVSLHPEVMYWIRVQQAV